MSVHRCTFQYFKTDDSTIGQNVLYFHNPDGVLTTSAIGTELNGNFWVYCKPFTTNVVRLETIFIKTVDSIPEGATFPFAADLSLGSLGFNVLHQVIGPVFQFFDGIGGPQHRGRMYPYGVASNQLNRNGPQPSMVTLFNTWRTNMLNRYGPTGASPLRHVIWHRTSKTWDGITDYRLAPRLGVQRRRNFGVGL